MTATATIAVATTAPTADNRPYTPYGGAWELWRARGTEAILSGPAGTGKSRAGLEKIHWCAEKYAGMRALVFRKRRKDLTEAALVTYEEKVLPAGHPCIGRIKREGRHSYRYPNGSVVVVGGLDDPSKVMSTEYDLAFGQECRELDEGDWESVLIRLRNGVMPYQQVIGDTNPDAPHHWIRQRAAKGGLTLLESRHEDNPVLYDRGKRAWTAAGETYIAKLDTLTGVRRDRLRFGRWAQAEGLVYDGYDAAVHVCEPFAVPSGWTRYWCVDFGYTNPFVCQMYAQDFDGRLYLYREVYMTGRLVEDHARRLLRMVHAPHGDWTNASEPRPRLVLCDHDAEDRATLERHLRLGTTAARKEISPGIQAVAARLRKDGTGKPRLLIFRDALDQRDPDLAEAHKPTCTAEEFESYVWDVGGGRRKGDVPIDRDNHGMDCVRYMCYWLDGRGGQRYTPAATPALTTVDEAPGGIFGGFDGAKAQRRMVDGADEHGRVW